MNKEVLKEPIFVEEIVKIISSSDSEKELREKLKEYHDNDIAQSLEFLTKEDRLRLFNALGSEWMSEIISYIEEPAEFIKELGVDKLAAVINEMDADDAVDLLEDVDEDVKAELRAMLDEDVKTDISLIKSYDEDEIGSLITTNYICIRKGLTIRQAMHELVKQAGENDNIATIYVVDENDKFYGAIDLKDLIIARENVKLDTFISSSYPYLLDHEKIQVILQIWATYLLEETKHYLKIFVIILTVTLLLAVPYGAFGYISHNECVHTYRI